MDAGGGPFSSLTDGKEKCRENWNFGWYLSYHHH
jgi:hypothetical protein